MEKDKFDYLMDIIEENINSKSVLGTIEVRPTGLLLLMLQAKIAYEKDHPEIYCQHLYPVHSYSEAIRGLVKCTKCELPYTVKGL